MTTRHMVFRLAVAGLLLAAIGTAANLNTPQHPQWLPPFQHPRQVPPAIPHPKPQWLWLSICGRFDSGICAGELL